MLYQAPDAESTCMPWGAQGVGEVRLGLCQCSLPLLVLLSFTPACLHVWVSTWKRQQAVTGAQGLIYNYSHWSLEKSGITVFFENLCLPASERHKMFGDRVFQSWSCESIQKRKLMLHRIWKNLPFLQWFKNICSIYLPSCCLLLK